MESIALLHIPNMFNYGSAMMAINFIDHFSNIANDEFAFFADLATDEDLKRLKDETLDRYSINRLSVGTRFFTGSNKLQKALNFRRNVINQVEDILSCDPRAVFILGGDDLSEIYVGRYITTILYRYYELSKRIPVFLVGQTIGPFFSWRIPAATYFLRHCHIYARSHLASTYLTNVLKLRNINEGGDLAFLDLPDQNNTQRNNNLLEKYRLTKGNYITIVPSGSVGLYTRNRAQYIQSWVKIIESLFDLNGLRMKKIVLLAHVVRPEAHDDRNSIEDIEREIQFKRDDRLVSIKDIMHPNEARAILGNGVFTLTGRMHAAISTFQMSKPAISISYSPKYKGVVGECLGLNDLVVEARSDSLWDSGQLVNIVMNRIHLVMQEYDNLVAIIEPGVKKAREKAMAQLFDIYSKF